MKQPEGGPRDSIAPKILKQTPQNFSVNFKAKKIIIEFDEYFRLQNQAKEFSLSPEVLSPPILKINKKNLEIEFQDTLEKNVTYTLNFGESIQDVNESNKLKNFSYVFATGPKLDSLSISGNVKEALTLKKPEKDVLVFLVPIDRDTILGKKRPSIFTYLDSSGNFKLKNLRENKYHLYALADEGGDKIYQQNVDQIGFFSNVIDLKSDTSGIEIMLFKEFPKNFVVSSRQINSDGSIGFIFNKPIKDFSVDVVFPSELNNNKQIWRSKANDTVKIWLDNMDFDSVKFDIKDNGKLLQQVRLSKSAKAVYKRDLLLSDNASSGTLALGQYYTAQSNFPIDNFDNSLIELLEDSVKRTDFKVLKDPGNFLKFSIQYLFKAKRNYIINFSPGAIQGKYSSKNVKYSTVFKQAAADEYGTLTVNYKVADTLNKAQYLVEFLDIENFKPITSVIIKKDTTILYKNFPAKKYALRVVEDVNRNGEWDTGDVYKRIQPERIWFAPKEMYLRANWETEEIVEIPLFDDVFKPQNMEIPVMVNQQDTSVQKQEVQTKPNIQP